MTVIVQYLCTVNKSAENVLQSGHVSIVCSLYFSWKWNSWICWSLWKEIQVHISTEDLHKVWWLTVARICSSASITVFPSANPHSWKAVKRQILNQAPQLLSRIIAERRQSKWKGQKSWRIGYNFVEVCSVVTKQKKEKRSCWAISWKILVWGFCLCLLVWGFFSVLFFQKGLCDTLAEAAWPFLVCGLRAANCWQERIFCPDTAHTTSQDLNLLSFCHLEYNWRSCYLEQFLPFHTWVQLHTNSLS